MCFSLQKYNLIVLLFANQIKLKNFTNSVRNGEEEFWEAFQALHEDGDFSLAGESSHGNTISVFVGLEADIDSPVEMALEADIDDDVPVNHEGMAIDHLYTYPSVRTWMT